MRAILLTTLSLAIATACYARDITWYKGTIVRTDRGVLVGEIARMSFDLLLYRTTDGSVTTYPAHKVSSFRYYDESEDINRIFISIPRRSGPHKTYQYYERVVSGKISVLRIQHVFDQTIDETSPDNFSLYIEEARIIRPIKSFRRKYFDQITKELDNQLVPYRSLNPNTHIGALSLIILYNKTCFASSVASLN